jgi:uncharacterized protein YbjQ (UPF0145 family)
MRRLDFLGFTAAIFLAACTPFVDVIDVGSLSPTEKTGAAAVETYNDNQIDRSRYTPVAAVQSTSCKHYLWDPSASQENAMEQLRVKAVRSGADALINPVCSSQGTSLTTNCWETVTCTASAVKLVR